jgi:hypothetical protein
MRASAQKKPGNSPIISRDGSTAIRIGIILSTPRRIRLVSEKAIRPNLTRSGNEILRSLF